MTLHALERATCVVRNTAAAEGRTRSVEPGRTSARHLHYGRIRLAAGAAPIDFNTEGLETGLVCLAGSASVTVADVPYTLERYDALYVPRDANIRVTPGASGCDLAEIAAPVERSHPVQYVSFSRVQSDPGLHFQAGGPSSKRELNILLGKNVEAGRLMAGVTFSEGGNWTSWPPHEHGVLAEEAYLYIDMPHPAFGVQLVYTNDVDPEVAVIVRDGDIVLIPQGYHPNVAAPGHSINFLWVMAATREDVDRQFGVVNVHPDFATTSSGLDAGKAGRK
jgi:5-deoxy-glucuronate isomerase